MSDGTPNPAAWPTIIRASSRSAPRRIRPAKANASSAAKPAATAAATIGRVRSEPLVLACREPLRLSAVAGAATRSAAPASRPGTGRPCGARAGAGARGRAWTVWEAGRPARGRGGEACLAARAAAGAGVVDFAVRRGAARLRARCSALGGRAVLSPAGRSTGCGATELVTVGPAAPGERAGVGAAATGTEAGAAAGGGSAAGTGAGAAARGGSRDAG